MSVLQRKDLEESPLADLHAIASELGLEGYRAMRREDLVKALLESQGVEDDGPADEPEPEPEPAAREQRPDEPDGEPVSGVLDVLPNGSGFLRAPEGPDVYVSPAQIRRCELRAGDEVAGPTRPARRNERHPSLVRVDTVNGHAAEPPEQRPRFEDLTAVHPTEELPGAASIASVRVGKGSRVAVIGAPGSGATRFLDELVKAAGGSDLVVSVVLVGVRPEEVTEWRRSGASVSGGPFDQSLEQQAQAAELAIERGKRVAERGGDALVVIDSLEHLPSGAARRVFGAARKLEEGGSLTVVAATGMAWEPQRQASTRISLDPPESRSQTLRDDLLK